MATDCVPCGPLGVLFSEAVSFDFRTFSLLGEKGEGGALFLQAPWGDPMYVCRKVKNSQARTGHQRGMGGRKTDDDDTHERHTDTNKLTRHTASGLPHILSGRTHHSGHVPPVAPPSTPRCQETNNSTTTQTGDRGERVRLEQACSASSNLVAGRKARTRPCVGSCEVSMDALLTG